DIAGLVGFLKNLRSVSYDMVVIGGKISPPSLTSYLLLGVSKGRLKVAIKQNDFNPFVNVRVSVETISEPFSKYELATKITG
ncbi:MAG: hypothetical protein N3B13_05060, partial [Deltaproteobacteria bacterium]|nr:hypothetical protein [Deltaproteobacteria bacterium]